MDELLKLDTEIELGKRSFEDTMQWYREIWGASEEKARKMAELTLNVGEVDVKPATESDYEDIEKWLEEAIEYADKNLK
ncbi:MAG: hypothetical protein E7198_07505 [Schwartzia succinivorans]|uniref:hypothetical protein n=1 Tax=Schwartzia succinivorans TaxID=55507 RepID=UPI002353B872|nr:hypothetical protein [Schwartzia succinivorans]MBE6097628.1 hypothetical protein [Schwartzia succinivorans]